MRPGALIAVAIAAILGALWAAADGAVENEAAIPGLQQEGVVFDGSAKEVRLIDRVTGNLISRRALGDVSEYKLYSVAGSPATVDLLPHGVATASTIVTLSAGGYSRTVTMTRGGHVRVSP